jgi:hypothetical protein
MPAISSDKYALAALESFAICAAFCWLLNTRAARSAHHGIELETACLCSLPLQRMSIYPQHVLDRLPDAADMLTSSGYI